jgi:hypothetical protein
MGLVIIIGLLYMVVPTVIIRYHCQVNKACYYIPVLSDLAVVITCSGVACYILYTYVKT